MKKFKKIILSICFVIAFIFSINIKLFAYEKGYNVNNNGDVESLNLVNMEYKIDNKYGETLIINGSKVIINGSNTKGSDNYFEYKPFANTINGQTYTLTFYNLPNTMKFDCWLNGVNYIINENNYITLTMTESLKNADWRFVNYPNNNNNNVEIDVMLNQGTTPLEYFPYGTYYNEKNTLNNNTYLSPFNIDYVESETFYINGQLQQGEEPVGYGGTYLFYDIEHTNAQGQNTWKSIINFNRILPSMTIYFNPTGNNFYELYIYKNEELVYSRNIRYNENLEESDYYFTLPEFNRLELYCTIDNVSAPNQEIKLANTYEQGYTYGYTNGYNQGYAEGESSSYGSGYSTGYQKGIREANQNSLYNMILAIVDTPIHIFKGIFDFNVLGINLTNFVLSLVSILIVVWLLKFFL